MIMISVIGPLNWIIDDKAVQLYSNEAYYVDQYSFHVIFVENGGQTIRLFDFRDTLVDGVEYDSIQSFSTALGVNIDTL